MAKSKAKLSNPEIGFVLNEADQLYAYYKRTLDVYCGPVLRHPAELIQAANFTAALAF